MNNSFIPQLQKRLSDKSAGKIIRKPRITPRQTAWLNVFISSHEDNNETPKAIKKLATILPSIGMVWLGNVSGVLLILAIQLGPNAIGLYQNAPSNIPTNVPENSSRKLIDIRSMKTPLFKLY